MWLSSRSQVLLSEYMYYLRPGGILYTITDVEDLANWHHDQLQEHPGFELLTEEELVGMVVRHKQQKDDPVIDAVYHSTEEGKKVERNAGKKMLWAARRKADSELIASVLCRVWNKEARSMS